MNNNGKLTVDLKKQTVLWRKAFVSDKVIYNYL